MTEQILTDAQTTAEEALLGIITDGVQAIRDSGHRLNNKTDDIKALATAYRLVVGGPQPGGLGEAAE
jgi:hypothetical protein